MAEDMLLRNLAPRTVDSYTYHIGRFAKFIGKPVEDATPEDVRSFQLHLVQGLKVSWSSFNQAVCGLRFLYRTTLPRPWHVTMIPFGKRPKKLSAVCRSQARGLADIDLRTAAAGDQIFRGGLHDSRHTVVAGFGQSA